MRTVMMMVNFDIMDSTPFLTNPAGGSSSDDLNNSGRRRRQRLLQAARFLRQASGRREAAGTFRQFEKLRQSN